MNERNINTSIVAEVTIYSNNEENEEKKQEKKN